MQSKRTRRLAARRAAHAASIAICAQRFINASDGAAATATRRRFTIQYGEPGEDDFQVKPYQFFIRLRVDFNCGRQLKRKGGFEENKTL